MAIFSADSPAMRFLSRFADLIILNLIFVATSLPLVTLGASLTALNHTAMKLITDEYDSVPRTYFASFRSNFRQATLIGLIALGLGAVVWAWYVVVDNLRVDPWVEIGLLVLVFIAAYRVIGTLAFVFPYQATFHDPLGRVLGNARRMSARHPLSAFLVVLTTVLPVVVSVFYPQVVVWGLVWLAIGFAAVAFVNNIVLINVFRRYGLETP